MKTVVVIPTIRDLSFLSEWEQEFRNDNVSIIVCEDHDRREVNIPEWKNIRIYSHKEIKQELGRKAWIIPVQNSGIRSFGFWKAWQEQPDMVVSLDDDCYPDQYQYLDKHYQLLNSKVTLDWVKTDSVWFTRGFPYLIRDQAEVVLNHGVWSGIPDFDAPTALLNPQVRFPSAEDSQVIPRHNFFPMCGMNLAFKTKVTPLMYFGLQGKDWSYDRFDDIWAGVFAKKVIDHLGYAVTSGRPSVEHRKKSDVFVNLKKEATGIKFNEQLWREVQKIQLTEISPRLAYGELMVKLPIASEPFIHNAFYFQKLREATEIWLSLFG